LTSNIVITLAVDGTTLYAGTTSGLFKSTDSGNNWNTVNNGLGVTYILYIYSYNKNLFAGTWGGGVYYSSNEGANWANISTGLTNLDDRAITIFNSNIYVATVGGVWKRPLNQVVSVLQNQSIVPNEYSLGQNYPNPFNPTTNIRYEIPNKSFVKLGITDMLGREIETLVNEKQSPGTYSIIWNASQYPSGVYFYKLTTDGFTDTKRMLLLK
jgi:hypothetical protein